MTRPIHKVVLTVALTSLSSTAAIFPPAMGKGGKDPLPKSKDRRQCHKRRKNRVTGRREKDGITVDGFITSVEQYIEASREMEMDHQELE